MQTHFRPHELPEPLRSNWKRGMDMERDMLRTFTGLDECMETLGGMLEKLGGLPDNRDRTDEELETLRKMGRDLVGMGLFFGEHKEKKFGDMFEHRTKCLGQRMQHHSMRGHLMDLLTDLPGGGTRCTLDLMTHRMFRLRHSMRTLMSDLQGCM